MKNVTWLMIVVFGTLVLFNLRTLHSVQEWIIGQFGSSIKILELCAVIVLFGVGVWVLNTLRRMQPLAWIILAIPAAFYGAYAALSPGRGQDGYPSDREIDAALVAMLFVVSCIIGRINPAKRNHTRNRPASTG